MKISRKYTVKLLNLSNKIYLITFDLHSRNDQWKQEMPTGKIYAAQRYT